MRSTFLLAICLFISTLIQAQIKPIDHDEIARRTGAYIKAIENIGNFSGSVLIAIGDEIIFDKSYGYAYKEFKVPFTKTTKFRIGSITKSFTAICVMQLQEHGKLKVQDPISKYLPDFPNGDRIKLHHLLSHSSGIVRDWDWDNDSLTTAEKIVESIKNEPLRFEPGEKMSYSNPGYAILQVIVEQVTGQPYLGYLRKNVLEPLGLQNTDQAFLQQIYDEFAFGYTHGVDTGGNFANVRALNGEKVIPAVGGLYSTTRDMLKFCKAIGKSKVLSKESWDLLLTPHAKDEYGHILGYGYFLYKRFGSKKIGHDGRIDGFRAGYVQFPEEDISIVILTNHDRGERDQIMAAIENIIAGKGDAIYQPPVYQSITMSEKDLATYVGKYDSKDFPFDVILKKGKLYTVSHGDPPTIMIPHAKDKFFCKFFDLQIEFHRDSNDKIIGATWTYQGESGKVERH